MVKGHWEIAVAEDLAALVFLFFFCCWDADGAYPHAAGNVTLTERHGAAWLAYSH